VVHNFNPGKHVEPFFFNILLNNVVFFKECELIFSTNLARSYYHECFVHGIVKTLNCLQDFIFEYGKINLYDDEKQNQIYNKLLEKHPFENSQNLPININIDVTCVGSQIGLIDPNYWIHDVGDSLDFFFCHMNKCIYSTSFVLKQMVCMSFQVHDLLDFISFQILK
jgi:hypothetical protein